MRILEAEARRQRLALERHWSAVQRKATPEAMGDYLATLEPVYQARLLPRIPQHQLGRVKARLAAVRNERG